MKSGRGGPTSGAMAAGPSSARAHPLGAQLSAAEAGFLARQLPRQPCGAGSRATCGPTAPVLQSFRCRSQGRGEDGGGAQVWKKPYGNEGSIAVILGES